MRRTRPALWRRLVVVGVALPVAFVALHSPAQALETHLDVGFLALLGVHGLVSTMGHTVLLAPAHHPAFLVIITSSCSSLAPVLALVCLGAVLPPGSQPRGRIARATFLASAAIVVGNLIRIDGSIWVGLLAGRASLVLFHNTVGSVFSFIYVLGGFLLMLWLLLPAPAKAVSARRRWRAGVFTARSETGGSAAVGSAVASEEVGVQC